MYVRINVLICHTCILYGGNAPPPPPRSCKRAGENAPTAPMVPPPMIFATICAVKILVAQSNNGGCAYLCLLSATASSYWLLL